MIFQFGKNEIQKTFLVGVPIHPAVPIHLIDGIRIRPRPPIPVNHALKTVITIFVGLPIAITKRKLL